MCTGCQNTPDCKLWKAGFVISYFPPPWDPSSFASLALLAPFGKFHVFFPFRHFFSSFSVYVAEETPGLTQIYSGLNGIRFPLEVPPAGSSILIPFSVLWFLPTSVDTFPTCHFAKLWRLPEPFYGSFVHQRSSTPLSSLLMAFICPGFRCEERPSGRMTRAKLRPCKNFLPRRKCMWFFIVMGLPS